jgi:hypothetical protein
MTHRERFRRTVHFQSVDRGVHWDFGYLGEALERWANEGLPPEATDVSRYYGTDPTRYVPVALGMNPGFEWEVIEERERTVVHRDGDGNVVEEIREGEHTIPHVIDNGLKTRADWETLYKPKFDPSDPARHQWDYKALAAEFNEADVPVIVSIGSFIGWIRNWVGAEHIGVMCYDDPELVSEMVGTLCDLYVAMLRPALEHIEVDLAWGWEDICFNNGPLVGPNLWREIISEPMTRVCKLLRQHGVDVILTDCDGNVQALAPVWLECGLNGFFPCEVAGNSDPVMLREMFGHDAVLFGGVNKRQLLDKKDILEELKRLAPLVEDGGFIPFVDHRVPGYVPYECYRYYEREKCAMLGFSPEEIESIEPFRGMPATLPSAIRR